MQTAKPFEACFQSRLRTVAAHVPGLEIVEEGADLQKRVDRGIVELDRGRRLRIARDQGRGIQPEDVVGLGRAPQRGVGQQLDPEIGDGVAQGAADARRVVVLLNVTCQPAKRLAPPLATS